MRLADAGEWGLRRLVAELLAGQWGDWSLPPGDDAALASGVLVSIDGYALSDYILPWMSAYDAGWKPIVAAMSDVVAKAGAPTAVLVSVGLDPSREVEWLQSYLRGAVDAARLHGAWVAGGDLNRSRGVEWVDVAAIGVPVAEPPRRSGARVGDSVYVTLGRWGLSGAALEALKRGEWEQLPTRVLAETSRPTLRLEFPRLVRECRVAASADSSDGLAATLWELAEASGVVIEVNSSALEAIAEGEAVEYASEAGVSVVDLVLYGGEEYEVVFTTSDSSCVEAEAARLGLRVARIGVVSSRRANGLVLVDGAAAGRGAWRHF